METMKTNRKMLAQEREYLERLLENSPTDSKRWREGIQNAFVLWAASLLIFVIFYLIIAWLVNLIFGLNVGLKNQYAIWVIGISAILCAVYSIISSIKWVKAWADIRPQLNEDLKNGEVEEELLKIVGVKRFQEPEHGGLIYFLRVSDKRILVLYDSESQDLGVEDKDPFSSSFKPLCALKVVRAPITTYFIETEFSGTPLEISETHDLNIAPEHWPEHESWCELPWEKLEEKLSA